jgi:cell division protein FtsQ
MKKLRNLILGILLMGYLATILGFVSKERSSVTCDKIDIRIKDSLDRQFVTKREVLRIINRVNDTIKGRKFENIRSPEIENQLLKHPAIKSAELYQTIKGDLRVEVQQREPVVRIIDKGDRNYYIDDEGFFMPAGLNYTEHVIVVNGNINADMFREGSLQKIDSQPDARLLKGVYELVGYINTHEFWHAQIVQIYINSKKELELIPLIGSHVVLFGSPENYEDKLFRLETVYKKGLNSQGWNKYELINLKYNNQVVCTKK